MRFPSAITVLGFAPLGDQCIMKYCAIILRYFIPITILYDYICCLQYVVAPTRRSTAEAFQILVSHAFGDAGSPYLIGVVSISSLWRTIKLL